MHRLIVLALVVVAAAPAHAHPTMDVGTCTVTIVRAPDEVRAEIDRWVLAERQSRTTLEVRVVPTANGYYLFARDGFGREHERVVPDAQTAGVLVASWVADDSFVIAIPVEPMAGVASSGTDPVRAPGTIAPRDAPGREYRLMLGGVIGPDDMWAARTELDVSVHEQWSARFALAVSHTEIMDEVFYNGSNDITVSAGLAHRWSRGPFALHIGAGAGLTRTTTSGFREELVGIFPVLETSALVSIQVGSWAFAAGPAVTAFARGINIYNKYEVDPDDEIRAMVFGGLQRQL